MDLDRVLAEDGAVAAVAGRLRALDGARVRVGLLRAAGLRGEVVWRSGTLQIATPSGDLPSLAGAATDRIPARVIDDAGVPLVTLLERDRLAVAGAGVRALLRPSFHIEIAPAGQPEPTPAPRDIHAATCVLAAEIEAAFRTALLLRPDPDPAASLRARHGVAPVETAPLADRSIRFAVEHRSATLHPDGDALRLTCIHSTIRGLRQTAEQIAPPGDARYPADGPGIERLGAAIRAFFSGAAMR